MGYELIQNLKKYLVPSSAPNITGSNDMLKSSETKNNWTSSQKPIGQRQNHFKFKPLVPLLKNCFFDKTMKFCFRETEKAVCFGNAL